MAENLELKSQASLLLGEVIKQTANNFPDPSIHPKLDHDNPFYHLYTYEPKYADWLTVDGLGTKAEIAERLYTANNDPKYFESLAFDTFAMIDGDAARFGHFLVGVSQNIETNVATPSVIAALAKGTKQACDEGRFALMTGETAQLGYRVSGFGTTRINWSAAGKYIKIDDKEILGDKDKLVAGQPVVAFAEKGLRANGFRLAKDILDAVYLQKYGYSSKADYFTQHLEQYLKKGGVFKRNFLFHLQQSNLMDFISEKMGHDFEEQVLLPWHKDFPEITKELLRPSLLYGKVINEAQGWLSKAKRVEITGAAHITGGGVPEKLKRLLAPLGLGAHLEHYEGILPDPKSIKELFALADTLSPKQKENLINEKIACETWNRGIGFIVVTKTTRDANKLRLLAQEMGCFAVTIGKIINSPKIEWRGFTWNY